MKQIAEAGMPQISNSRWIAPTLICGLLATVYAHRTATVYRCEQLLTVECTPSVKAAEARAGSSLEQIVRRHARHPALLAAALQSSQSEGFGRSTSGITDDDIRRCRQQVSVTRSAGISHDEENLLLLAVEAKTGARASMLCDALYRQLADALSMVPGDHQAAVTRPNRAATLEAAEAEVARLATELEQTQAAVDRHNSTFPEVDTKASADLLEQLAMLQELVGDLHGEQYLVGSIQSISTSALPPDAPLRRLHDDWIAAEQKLKSLNASMRERHPRLIAAAVEEEQARKRLFDERERFVARLERDLNLVRQRIADHRRVEATARQHHEQLITLRAQCQEIEDLHRRAARRLATAAKHESDVPISISLATVGAPRASARVDWRKMLLPITVGTFCGLGIGVLRLGWTWLTRPSRRRYGERQWPLTVPRSSLAIPVNAASPTEPSLSAPPRDIAAAHDAAIAEATSAEGFLQGEAEPPTLPLPVGPPPPARRQKPATNPNDPVTSPDKVDADSEEEPRREPPEDRLAVPRATPAPKVGGRDDQAEVPDNALMDIQGVPGKRLEVHPDEPHEIESWYRVDPPTDPIPLVLGPRETEPKRTAVPAPPESLPVDADPIPDPLSDGSERSARLLAEVVAYRESLARQAKHARSSGNASQSAMEASLLSMLEDIYEEDATQLPARRATEAGANL